MLTLILGRAGSGKTSHIYAALRRNILAGDGGQILLVPEQFSHDAEHQMSKVCGDSASLYGEVLSFSRLCSRVFAETGGTAAQVLDGGGRILFMSRAIHGVSDVLNLFGSPDRRVDFYESMLRTYDELKSAGVSPAHLGLVSEKLEGPLAMKLRDLSLIFSSYESILTGDKIDPGDRLSRLAEQIGDSTIGRSGQLFIDGFTDFTALELRVLDELLKKGARMTVCLTCDGLDGTEEIFETSRKTAARLLHLADTRNVETEVVLMEGESDGKNEALRFLEKELFSYRDQTFNGQNSAVEVFSAREPLEECELAAANILALVRGGARYRDIAVVARGFEDYRHLVEDVFEQYGVPVFIGAKSDILQKPPVAMILSALEILLNGWDYESVFRYLKTGMTRIASGDCDLLENYVIKWNIRGSMWTRKEDWILSPAGYVSVLSEEDIKKLETINRLRREVAVPLSWLDGRLRCAETMGQMLAALYEFLEKTDLPKRLGEKADRFLAEGDLQSRDEYLRLWDIVVNAMEQFDHTVGDLPGDRQELYRLLHLVLSQYDVDVIPVSLDRVSAGDMSRLRRRGVRYLIVLGATDDALPGKTGSGGIISESELDELQEAGICFSDTSEEKIYREMNVIYASLTLPDSSLLLTYPESSGGTGKRPAFIVDRICRLFHCNVQKADSADYKAAAAVPGFELAAEVPNRPQSISAAAAAAYFLQQPLMREKLLTVRRAAEQPRGRLSDEAAKKLYGGRFTMSASRVDKYFSCRFAFFLQYGLKAKKRSAAGFDAPEAGTFMHYVLEHVTRDLKESGGFHGVTDEQCKTLTMRHVRSYVDTMLSGFQDKSGRFRYLFHRLTNDALSIVTEMVRELDASDFLPLDFELEFSSRGDLPPATLKDGEAELSLHGFVDRVDGWTHEGRLYLRVIDYKTGRKSFSLSDIYNGLGMQMLIYLFTLQKNGAARYGREIVPAGVLYAPAREVVLPAQRCISDAELQKLRAKSLRRSGIILDIPEVISAMERSDTIKYLPVKTTKDGSFSADSLVTLEQMGRLSDHIDKTLLEIAGEMGKGRISADPYYRNESDYACLTCDFRQACHFDESIGTDRMRVLKKLKSSEIWDKLEGGGASG